MVEIFAAGFLVGAVFVASIALFLRRKPWHVESTEEVEHSTWETVTDSRGNIWDAEAIGRHAED